MPKYFDQVTGLVDFAHKHNLTEVTCTSRNLMKTYISEGVHVDFFPTAWRCQIDADFYFSPDIRKNMPHFFEFDYDVDLLDLL